MTLKADIIADAKGLFLNTNEFAEDVTRYPKGSTTGSEVIKAVVFLDAAEGTREVGGDGRKIHNERTAIRESVTIEVPIDQQINEPSGAGYGADQFLIAGVVYKVKRISGSDHGMKTVILVRPERKTVRQPKREG